MTDHPVTPDEALAQRFHEAYERLAPSFGYETREASAKPWGDVPERNRSLMIAVCAEIADSVTAERDNALAEVARRQGDLDHFVARFDDEVQYRVAVQGDRDALAARLERAEAEVARLRDELDEQDRTLTRIRHRYHNLEAERDEARYRAATSPEGGARG